MSRIRILPEAVANRIAAGEVVERPASVVKELLENALDAGARSIRVEVESGGKRMIRVTDDGCGMNADDALLAFERHATSKLRNVDDLLEIDTLGFRGEALPSIASVSRLLLETRPSEPVGADLRVRPESSAEGAHTGAPLREAPDEGSLAPTDAEGVRVAQAVGRQADAANAETAGVRVEFAGGKLVSVKPAGLPPGTSVSVADLFYCVPARRKFLKSETTELGHIASLVTHYALANPDKQFILSTPSQEIIHATPVETLGERVYQLFGRQALEELLEVPATTGAFRASITEPAIEDEEQSAALTVRGFVSRPEVQRVNRNSIYIFVNSRLVRDRLILHAISEAYRNITPPGVFPAVLLFMEMPAQEVDVNVHPAKVEVRFRHPSFVHDFTRDAVRAALTKARPIADFPAARNAGVPPVVFAGGGNVASGAASSAPTGFGAAAARAVIPAMGSEAGIGESFALDEAAPMQPENQRFQFGPHIVIGSEQMPGVLSGAAPDDQHGSLVTSHESQVTSDAPTSIATLKPLGQVSNSFIVAVNGEGLWIIDQHVAHERVLFEQHLRARREGALTGQRTLAPIVVELSPRQLVTLEHISDELRANGFDVEPMGARSVAVQAAPAGVSASDAEKLLLQILDGVEREAAAISIDSLQARIAASTSCQAAIKVNMPLDQTKMEWLLAELSKTEAPMSCPHGRPVVLRYSLREIERAFKRI